MSVALGFAPRSMSARLAVKPDLHRQMLGWGQNTIRLQTRSPVRRWHGSKTNDSVVDRYLACTWLTTTPEQLTPEDILSSFPIAVPDSALEYIPVILFTPAFAHWADARSTFVEQCLNRVYHKALDRPSQVPIHAVIAVIDRLPNHPRDENTLGNAVECEGLSILLAKGENIKGKAATPRQIRSVETEEPTLLFSFRKDAVDGQTIRQPAHEIGLRLANTIFLNGKENTLFGTRWAYNHSSKRFKLEEAADLSTCSVTVNPGNTRNSLELPLHPVGERRKVISSMGNILRQVSKHSDGKPNEPMPASFELEKELPRYIAENDIADQRVSVWALIETSAESPYAKSRHSQGSLAKSIQLGAKLHRVMSGGGGWGKKQGLLSLDPEMSFGQPGDKSMIPLHQILSLNDESSTHEVASPLEQPMSLQDLSTLSQAAEPGDYVQFFASIEGHDPHSGRNNNTADSWREYLSCSFGVVSDADGCLSQTEKPKALAISPNYFGALSEKSITYMQPLPKSGPNETRESRESRTKIDVPGSRVTLILE
ncbi:hypothetical protein BDW62DRAFT_98063 [Aspergillus aurantiobrunneus]